MIDENGGYLNADEEPDSLSSIYQIHLGNEVEPMHSTVNDKDLVRIHPEGQL